jgi:hypothetical protein
MIKKIKCSALFFSFVMMFSLSEVVASDNQKAFDRAKLYFAVINSVGFGLPALVSTVSLELRAGFSPYCLTFPLLMLSAGIFQAGASSGLSKKLKKEVSNRKNVVSSSGYGQTATIQGKDSYRSLMLEERKWREGLLTGLYLGPAFFAERRFLLFCCDNPTLPRIFIAPAAIWAASLFYVGYRSESD